MPQRATPLSSAAAVADRRIQGIQDVPLDQLRPHPENPRRISRDRLDQLKKHGDVVLECFGGSGTSLIAAEETGRRAYLMEIDPGYCDVIRDRWQAWSADG